MNLKSIFLLTFLASTLTNPLWSTSLPSSFPPGQGSKFIMEMGDGIQANIFIYITQAQDKGLGVEYNFQTTNTFVPVQLTQQFALSKPAGNGPLEVKEGYIKAPEWDKAEKMLPESLKGLEDIQVSDFLFQDTKEIEQWKVGEEEIQAPIGKLKTIHYRRSKGQQTVDFWISDKARPLGLVKLVSKNDKKASQNYTILLEALLKNVKPVINPKEAIPLSAKGKEMLENPVIKNTSP